MKSLILVVFAVVLANVVSGSIFNSNKYNVIAFEPARLDTTGTLEIIVRNDIADKKEILLDSTDAVYLMLPNYFNHDKTRQCLQSNKLTCEWSLNNEKTTQQVRTQLIPSENNLEGPVIQFSSDNQAPVKIGHHDLLKIRCQNMCTPLSLNAPTVAATTTAPTTHPTTATTATTAVEDDTDQPGLSDKYAIVIIEHAATEPILEQELSIVDDFKRQDSSSRFVVSITGDNANGIHTRALDPHEDPSKRRSGLDQLASKDQKHRVEVLCEYLEKMFKVRDCRLENVSGAGTGNNVLLFSLHHKDVRSLLDLFERSLRHDSDRDALREQVRAYKRQALGAAATELSNDDIDKNDTVDLTQFKVPNLPDNDRLKALNRFVHDLLGLDNSVINLHPQTIPNH